MLQRPVIKHGDLKFYAQESIFWETRIKQLTYICFKKQIASIQCWLDRLFKGKLAITGKQVSNTFHFNYSFNKEYILDCFPRLEN